MRHGCVQHGRDKPALYHVDRVTESSTDTEFKCAGFLADIEGNDLSAQHLDEPGSARIHCVDCVTSFHATSIPMSRLMPILACIKAKGKAISLLGGPGRDAIGQCRLASWHTAFAFMVQIRIRAAANQFLALSLAV